MTDYGQLTRMLGDLALVLPRIAAAFLVLPILGSDTLPGSVRNSFFVTMALVALPVAQQAAPASSHLLPTAPMVLKEIFLGVCIGYSFGLIFWAIGSVGNIIDTKTGATLASIVDPLAGHETSLTGAFLSRFATWLFFASGGMLVFLEILLGSYAVWPPGSAFPLLHQSGPIQFVGLLDQLMVVSLMLAAPALIVLFMVELGFGLINRYAQQLNVLPLASSIKTWIASWIVLLSLGVIVRFVMERLAVQHGLLGILQRML